jgi:hypothetical protein
MIRPGGPGGSWWDTPAMLCAAFSDWDPFVKSTKGFRVARTLTP